MTTTASAPKKKREGKYDTYFMFAGAAFLMWLGGHLDNTPAVAHHQLLVSSAQVTEAPLKDSVILVLQHRKAGSLGLVINKPAKEGDTFIGGPMEPEKVYALHSTEVLTPDSLVMKDIDTALVEGQPAIDKLIAAKPKWVRVIHGYTGWGKRQLNDELKAATWQIVLYDEDFVRNTPPADMWAKAQKMPMRQVTY
ncbi:MAG: hypothetical protein K0R10_941 [Alphaproteobacteria bacterium]|jgi:putative transcriptional regulator|nr:hypothetical protein [Alphaproteobacteria bacterium]